MANKESGEDILRAILEKGNKNVKDQVAKILGEETTTAAPVPAPKTRKRKLGTVVGKVGTSSFFRTPDGAIVDENGKPVSIGLAKAFAQYEPKAAAAVPAIEKKGTPVRTAERELRVSIQKTNAIIKAQQTINKKIPTVHDHLLKIVDKMSKQNEMIINSFIQQNQDFQDKVVESMTGVKAPTRAGGAKRKITKGVGSSRAAARIKLRDTDRGKFVRDRAERIGDIRMKRNIAIGAGAGILGAAAGLAIYKGLDGLTGGDDKEPIKPYEGPGVAATGSAREAIDFFVGKGWTKDQAIGLAANLQVESNFRTNALGDNGRAYGIAQWHPDRQQIFQKTYNKDIRQSDFKEQLEFVDWELNNNEKRAGAKLREAANAADAAAIIDQFYERSSGAHRSKRVQLAQQYAKGEGLDAKATVKPSTPSAPQTSSVPGPSGSSAAVAAAAAASSGSSQQVRIPGASGGSAAAGAAASSGSPQQVAIPGPSGGSAAMGAAATVRQSTPGTPIGQAQTPQADGSSAGNVRLNNQGATRNKPVSPYLMNAISTAVKDVYGPGATAEIYSGGQDSTGGRRVGSTRHDNGMAADLYVYANGRRVTGDDLGRLAQYWLARRLGGVGLEMRGGGIHLDQHTNRHPYWFYGAGETAKARSMVMAGAQGQMPDAAGQTQIAQAPGAPAAPSSGGAPRQYSALGASSRAAEMRDMYAAPRQIIIQNNIMNSQNINYRTNPTVGARSEQFNPLAVALGFGIGKALRLF